MTNNNHTITKTIAFSVCNLRQNSTHPLLQEYYIFTVFDEKKLKKCLFSGILTTSSLFVE